MLHYTLLVVLLWAAILPSLSYPFGADPAACSNGQVPAGHGCASSSIDSAIVLSSPSTSWAACSSLSLTIKTGSNPFRGYLLSAFPAGTNTQRLGSFSAVDGSGQTRCAVTGGSAITHVDSNPKQNYGLTWTPPDPISAQTLDFISTIVQQSACQWNYIQLKGLVHQASLVPPQLPQTIAISGSSFDAVNQLAMVAISWTGSVSSFCQGNAAVQFFSLQVKGGNWTSFTDVVPLSLSLFNPSASTTSATIPLPLGFSFTLRLFANSTVGTSISSTLAITTPATASNAPPSPPATISLVSSTSTSLTLNWTAVDNVLSYTLQMSAGSATGPFQTIYTGALPSFTATQLSASVLYYFQVSSIALSGSSSFSSIFSFATSGCPQLCNGAGTCDTISFTCICNPQTFGQYCQFAVGSGAAPTPMSPQVSLGFFYDTTAANVYFRALLFDLPDGGSVSITLTPGLNIGGTNPRVYRLHQLAWRNNSDASLAVVTLSEFYLVPSGKMLAADNTHATLIAAYSKRIGQRQYVDVQWVRPAALNSIDSTDISIHSSLCFVNASCGYFSVTPFGVESTADATGSLVLTFNGGTNTASNGYSGNSLPTTAPLSFVHASDYALAYYISGSNIYFQIAIFNLKDGNFAALMFGAEDGMTNAYGVLLAFGTDAFAAPSLTKVSLSEISSKTFNTPTLMSQSNVQVLNVSAVQLAGQNGVLVEFVRPLATTNSLDKVFVPGQNMYASYALFRTSQWGDRHSHGDAGQLILQLPKQGFGGIIVVTRAYMWQVYLPVIVSLGVIAIIGFILSRDCLHSPLSSFSSFLSYVYHTRPYPFAPNVSATGQKYSWFDFFTLSARHALFDWTLVEYGVLAVYGAALGTFIVLGGKRFGDRGGDGLTFFYFIYGHCTAVHLALTIIPMQRHSPLLHLLGLPFERALKWHRYLGRMTVAFVWVHFITMLDLYTPGSTEPNGALHVYSPICGFAAFLCINVQWLVSLDFIRRRFFEFFYSIHVLLGPAIVALAAIHVDYFLYYMIAPASFYAANLFLRWRSGRRTVSVKSIALLTPHIAPVSKLELQLEDFRFEAGQYVLVSIADLGFSEEHPLSITSAPALDGDSSVITLHALAVNAERRSWTARLAELASKSETFQVSIDGPFGRPSVAYLQGYSQIVLASGGIGATPMLSIALYLAHLADAKRLPEHIKAIHFLWVSRHSECFHQWFPDELHQIQRLGSLFQFHFFCTTPADGTLLTSQSPEPVKRQPVNVAEKRRSRESRMEGGVEMASPDELLSSTNRSPDVNQDNVRVQMSQSTDITEQKNGGMVMGWKPTITFGRPDLEVLFGHVQGSMQGKVCVLTCGPLGLMNGVQMAANKYGMHLHKETFYF